LQDDCLHTFSPVFWPTGGTFDPGAPVIASVSQAALKSGHLAGIHVVMADGSARFLSAEIDLVAYQNMADRAEDLYMETTDAA